MQHTYLFIVVQCVISYLPNVPRRSVTWKFCTGVCMCMEMREGVATTFIISNVTVGEIHRGENRHTARNHQVKERRYLGKLTLETGRISSRGFDSKYNFKAIVQIPEKRANFQYAISSRCMVSYSFSIRVRRISSTMSRK